MAANATSQLARRGNRKAFLVAALFGLLAAFLSLTYLRNAAGDGDAAAVPMASVVVAARDIPERTVIKEGMVEVRQIPLDGRHALALTEREAAVGALTRVPVATGEQLLRNKLADGLRDIGFSANIPRGQRAVAIGVSEVIASGGHIAVGDFVDVIGVFEVHDPAAKNTVAAGQGDKPKPMVAATVLQNVQVLAVAQKAAPTIQSSTKADETKKESDSAAKSVTLALTPEQAERVFLSEQIGQLRLALRPFGEAEQRAIGPIVNNLGSIVGP